MNKSKNKTQKKTLTRKRARHVGKKKSHKSKVGKNKSHKSKVTKKNKSRRGGGFTGKIRSLVSGLRNRPKKPKYKRLTYYYLSNDPTDFYVQQTSEVKEHIKYLDDKYNNKELYKLLKNVVATLELPDDSKKILDTDSESIVWKKVMVLIYNWDFYWNLFKGKTDLEKIKFVFPLCILAQCEIFGWGFDPYPFSAVTFFVTIFNPVGASTAKLREEKVRSELWDNRNQIEGQLDFLLNNINEFEFLKKIYDKIKKAFGVLKEAEGFAEMYENEKINEEIKDYVNEALDVLSSIETGSTATDTTAMEGEEEEPEEPEEPEEEEEEEAAAAVVAEKAALAAAKKAEEEEEQQELEQEPEQELEQEE